MLLRGPVPDRAPEPLRQAHLRGHAADRGARAPARPGHPHGKLYDGDDTTISASDWPHHDFDHPMKLNQVPFSEEQRRKIFGENALELFGIDRTGRRR